MEAQSSSPSQKSEDGKRNLSIGVYASVAWRYVQEHVAALVPGARVTLLSLFLIYLGIPIFVKSNQWIMPKVVFANVLRWPPFINLSRPIDFGLNNTRHFHLHVEDGINVGAWHVLPKSMQTDRGNIPWDAFEETLGNGNMIFLYLHGNSGTRGSHHRVQLYKLLSKLGFHVLAFDYRGYGDSTGDPTENGVVKDAYFAYQWLKKRAGGSKIFIWGHSLGTGVSAKLGKKLCDEGDPPAGIILESPFNNIREAAYHHPLAMPYRLLPWFEWIFVDGIRDHGIFFRSDENILSITPNIMILHAEDDYIVPFDLGKKLYEKAKAKRSPAMGEVEFVPFETHLGYGHKLIYQAPELSDLIRKFIAKCK